MIKKTFFILLSLLVLFLVIFTSCYMPINQTAEITMAITTMQETTTPETEQISFYDNIDDRIKFVAEDKMFPDNWYTVEINPKAISLSSSEIERSKNVVIKALKKYPESVLIKNLSKIYVLSYLEFYGVEFGGTNATGIDVVYIENKGDKEIILEKRFHAEFSSILLTIYNNLFDESKWTIINPKDFKYYSATGVETLKNGNDSTAFDPKLNDIGFLYEYAQSSFENDFNSFAESIFANDSSFWRLIDTYPKLKEKFDLTVKFYNVINPIFTEDYFREISK